MKFEGAIPALATPFDPSGDINEEMLRRLTETHIAAGATGLYLCGSTGEGLLLRTEERKRVVEIVTGQNRHRIPLIVHVGSLATAEAVALAQHAERVGVDAVSAIPPIYFPVSLDGIHRHYETIGASSKLPLILYNIPTLTNVSVTPKMMERFLTIPTVAGIKFSSYNLYELRQIANLDGGRLSVISGNDEVFLAALAMGASASIGLNLNFALRLYLDIFRNYRAGNWVKAEELQNFAVQIVTVLLQFPPIPSMKEIMRFKGYDLGAARRPLDALTEPQKQSLYDQLSAIGFFAKDLGL